MPLSFPPLRLVAAFFSSLSSTGLILGTLFFAASLTPSLVPRSPLIQGALGGLCLAAGYGIGVLLRLAWAALGLPSAQGRAHRIVLGVAAVVCSVAAAATLWWSTGWQNRLRDLMGMPAVDGAGPFTLAVMALALFLLIVLVCRLFGLVARRLSVRLARHVPGPTAALLALVVTSVLFWNIGNGLLVQGVMRALDGTYRELDGLFDEASTRPQDPLKTGGPGSLLSWSELGRQGRYMVSAAPDRARIAGFTGSAALEPLRVYVGLNSADSPQARAALALAELKRIGAFARSNLVIVTPTGTGWVDPDSQSALEYVLQGDVATVSVQYSYLASWIALLADPDYGVETARAVFSAVYDHWRSLPEDARPRLYLHGLSLGALNSNLSHDLHQVIGDPYHGALWSGPPFNTPTWRVVTADRNPGTPAWLPQFRDGSVIRFTSQHNALQDTPAPWGPYRVIFLQYASDAVTFFEPSALWRRPDWMQPPLGPDVAPDLRWIPVVSAVQLAFDVMFAVEPPKGYGHTYAFEHYVDAWASLTDASGWSTDALERLKRGGP